jgi:hypothetical protein
MKSIHSDSVTSTFVEEGSKRITKKFAWLPMKTDCGFIVWLDWYLSYEVYYHAWDDYLWVTWKRVPTLEAIMKD